MRIYKLLLVIAIALAMAIVSVPAGAQYFPVTYGLDGCGFGCPLAVSTCGTGIGFTVQNTIVAQSCFSTIGGAGFGFGCGYPLTCGFGAGTWGVPFGGGLGTCGIPFTTGISSFGFPTGFW